MRLGLFHLSLGILGVLILGLLNRLLIQDIQVPAVLVVDVLGCFQLTVPRFSVLTGSARPLGPIRVP